MSKISHPKNHHEQPATHLEHPQWLPVAWGLVLRWELKRLMLSRREMIVNEFVGQSLVIDISKSHTFVHAGFEEIFSQPERFGLICWWFLTHQRPQLLLKAITDGRKGIHWNLLIRNIGGLQESATGKVIEVVAWLNFRVHCLQNTRSYIGIFY